MKLENKTCIKNFLLGEFICLLLCIIPMYFRSLNTSICYPIEQWNYAQDVFTFFYPLVCTVPFCTELFQEQQSGFFQYIVNRQNPMRYIGIKYLYSGSLVAIMIFSASFLSAIVGLFFIEPTHPSSQSFLIYYLWGDILVSNPLRYAFYLSLWRIIPAILYFSFGFMLAIFQHKVLPVLLGPFIYSILENFLLSAIGMPAISIITSFYPSRLALGYVKPIQLLVGPIILLLVIVSIICIECFRRHKESSRCLGIV